MISGPFSVAASAPPLLPFCIRPARSGVPSPTPDFPAGCTDRTSSPRNTYGSEVILLKRDTAGPAPRVVNIMAGGSVCEDLSIYGIYDSATPIL